MSIVAIVNDTAAGVATTMTRKLESVLSVSIPKKGGLDALKRLCASKADLIEYTEDDKDWSTVELYVCVPYANATNPYAFSSVVPVKQLSDVEDGDIVLTCVAEELKFYKDPCSARVSVKQGQNAKSLLEKQDDDNKSSSSQSNGQPTSKKAPGYLLTEKFRSQFPSPIGRLNISPVVFRATCRCLVEVGKLASYGMFEADDSMLQAMVEEYLELPDAGVLEPFRERKRKPVVNSLERKRVTLDIESGTGEESEPEYSVEDDEYSAFTRFMGFIHRTRHVDYHEYRRWQLSKQSQDEDSQYKKALSMRLIGWAREEMEWLRSSFGLGTQDFDWDDSDRKKLFHEAPDLFYHAVVCGYETWMSHAQELYARIVNFPEDPLGDGKPEEVLRIPLQAPHPWVRFAHMVHMSVPSAYLANIKAIFRALPRDLLGKSSSEKDLVEYCGTTLPQCDFVLFGEDAMDAIVPTRHQPEQLESQDKSVLDANINNEDDRFELRTAGFKMYGKLCTKFSLQPAGVDIESHKSIVTHDIPRSLELNVEPVMESVQLNEVLDSSSLKSGGRFLPTETVEEESAFVTKSDVEEYKLKERKENIVEVSLSSYGASNFRRSQTGGSEQQSSESKEPEEEPSPGPKFDLSQIKKSARGNRLPGIHPETFENVRRRRLGVRHYVNPELADSLPLRQ